MPIANINDAQDVRDCLGNVLRAADVDQRIVAMRRLFVEVLDYEPDNRIIALDAVSGSVLPRDAHLVARRDGVSTVYVPLAGDRVTNRDATAAARSLSAVLGDDLLLLFINGPGDQFHVIHPSFAGSRPTLSRMIVRRGEHHRTVVERIANMWNDYGRMGKSIQEAIREAFSVEPVTKAFFQAYRDIFQESESKITGFASDPGGREDRRRFTQTMFNRLMFVYFLSRKGWLSFNGDTDYLNALWEDSQSGREPDDNFYTNRLAHLFFAGLSDPQSRDLNRNNSALHAVIGDVPFLNGGLFEQNELDKPGRINVPDDAIEPILSKLFDKFNFTVTESTPYDTEVAVDPEMLGKVFEELVTGRHESGSYYTPRPVVAFMCREALKGYLAGQDTGLAADAIADFVDAQRTEGLSVFDARRIAHALEEVTVVDPACGSGAYLLGMMQELIELQTTLYNAGVDSKAIYDLKLEIIQRNLYGVDIDDFAVNIAMLRLWLSLAIDYEGDIPEPLPNLEFKIACGDSLAAPNPDVMALRQAFGEHLARELGSRKAEFMRATSQTDKDVLRERIAQLEDDCKEWLDDADVPENAIDWRIRFGEVLGDRGGFDIVVANPPYVRQEKIKPSEYKNALAAQFSEAVTKRSDLYCYFYARALQLLREGGTHIFICSNSWLDVGYGAKLQEYLLKNASVRAIYESAVERQFSTAQINTIISIIRNSVADAEHETRFVSLRDEFDRAILDPSLRREITKTRSELLEAGLGTVDARGRRKFVGDKWGGKYLRAPDIYHHILGKAGDKLVRLGDITTVRRGITTGANEFFYLDQEKIDLWGIEPEFRRPVMTSPRDSRSIAVDTTDLPRQLFMCHQDKDVLERTRALAYIKWGEAQGYHLRPSCRSRPRWYDVGRRETSQMAINYLIGTTGRTFLVTSGLHFSDNFQEINSHAVQASLTCVAMNATISQLMFNVSGRANFGGGLMKIQTFEVENLTVVDPRLLPNLDARVFDSYNWDVLEPSTERRQIDDAVFDILELTQDERDAVYEGVWEMVRNREQRAGSV